MRGVVSRRPGSGTGHVHPAPQALADGYRYLLSNTSLPLLENAVKHFKFTVSGKRRIHATPDSYEVAACRPWLTAELAAVAPELVVLLGATAAKTIYGPSFRVTQQRGTVMDWPQAGGPRALATIHPSAVLRADDRETALAGLVADLRVVGEALR